LGVAFSGIRHGGRALIVNWGNTLIDMIGATVVTYAGAWVISLIRSPRLLDDDHLAAIQQRDAEVARLSSKPTPIEEQRLQHVTEALAKCSTDELRFLGWLLRVGETEYKHMPGSGSSQETISQVLRTGVAHQVLKDRDIDMAGRKAYRVSPELVQALTTYLREKT
jgi:hypothetical protein